MRMRFGTVSQVDYSKGLARVTFKDDGIESNWMPVSVPNSKETKFSLPVAVNEHVWCMMEDKGDIGVVAGAIYSKASQPSITGGKVGVTFDNGSKVEFDPGNGKLTVVATGDVEITASSKVKITGDLEVTGKIEANGEVTANKTTTNVSLSTHIHPTPAGPSSAPTPGT